MSSTLPPYMAQPPIYDAFLKSDNKTMSSNWENYVNSITRITGLVIVNDWILQPVSKKRISSVATLVAPQFSEIDRNNLDNAWNGMLIYNITSKRINFRENDTWVTFTPIPA